MREQEPDHPHPCNPASLMQPCPSYHSWAKTGERVQRNRTSQGYGVWTRSREQEVKTAFSQNSKGRGCTEILLPIQEHTVVWDPRTPGRPGGKDGNTYPVLLFKGEKMNLEPEPGELQKKHARSSPQKEGTVFYCPISPARNRSFLPKSWVGAAQGHPPASPPFPSGQVYSYHLPIDAKRWVQVLQDLHYPESFLGNRRLE